MKPLLFLIPIKEVKQENPVSFFYYFVNDILTNFNDNIEGLFTHYGLKLFILLFADDAVLFAHTPEAMHSLLKDIQYYCNTWKLKVNTNKTKLMIFEDGRHTTRAFLLTNTVREIVKTFKYLGLCLF